MFSPRMIIPQYQYKSLVGDTIRRIDLVYVHGIAGPRVAIECKVQDSGGSVDEKLAFTALNAMQWKFVDYVWIILSGKGFGQGWAKFLEDCPRLYNGSNSIRVFTSVDELRRPIKLLVESGDAVGR